jgi:ketosteroid isomerase-like protein
MAANSMRMLDDTTTQVLVRHWQEGWNAGDIDTIMAPFARDVVFSSPGISMLTGDPAKTTVEGYDALRAYIEGALSRSRGLRYRLDTAYVGTDSIVLVYDCGLPDGDAKRGADLMRVGQDGKVVEWRCHY